MKPLPTAIIMAGGKGRRMHPYTVAVPKALLPVGSHIMLDILITQMRRAGCGEVVVSLGHLASVIRAYLEGHGVFALPVRCVQESSPLGTAGALGLVDPPPALALVINCDVLSDVNFADVIREHEARGADMTIVGIALSQRMSYGLLELDDRGGLAAWREGFEVQSVVAGGSYLLGPRALAMITRGEPLDMPVLADRVARAGGRVDVHTHRGAWFDVGTLDSHAKGVEAFNAEPERFGVARAR